MSPLFTIGYEATTVDRVLGELRLAGITRLVDVRAVPNSRKPGFSRRQLEAEANERGIAYTHIRALGTPAAGRAAVRRGDVSAMHAIFADHMASDLARAGLAHATTLASAEPCCLLCFERVHTHCHRSIVAGLIAGQTNQPIRHLVADRP